MSYQRLLEDNSRQSYQERENFNIKQIGTGIANAGKTVGKGTANAAKTVGKGTANAAKTVGKGVQKANPLNWIKDMFAKVKYFISFACCICVTYCLWNFGILQMGYSMFTSAVATLRHKKDGVQGDIGTSNLQTPPAVDTTMPTPNFSTTTSAVATSAVATSAVATSAVNPPQ